MINDIIDDIIDHFDCRFQLSLALGQPCCNVNGWCKNRNIPEIHLYVIEGLSHGKFRADKVKAYQEAYRKKHNL